VVHPFVPYFLALIGFVIGLRRFVPGAWRPLAIFIASMVFLALYDLNYALILPASLAVFWGISQWMERRSGAAKKRILVLAVGLALAVVVFYKYAGLLPALFQPAPAVPLGLSYYSFRLIHYLVERYRGRVAPLGLWRFLHYLLFFPTLAAGPIERADRFEPRPETSPTDLLEATRRIIFGLGKSLVLGALLARWCLPILQAPGSSPRPELLLAVYALAFYIYFDFAGYSDLAIGTARLLDYQIMENFDRPYLATSPAEFWRRWHMSLSYWLRDYLYIPLGGSRVSRTRHYLNYLAVMLACGLWHGGEAHFLAWGAYHGLGLIVYHLGKTAWPSLRPAWLPAGPWARWPAVAVTFHFVAAGWLLFFFDLRTCGQILVRLAGGGGG